MAPKRENLTSKRFGRLVIIKDDDDYIGKTGYKRRRVLCKCDCGNITSCDPRNLKKGHIKSCGCLLKEKRYFNTRTHGMTNTKIWKSWRSIRERCLCKTHRLYKYYGGRGIKICNKWLDFKGFYEDMGELFKKHIEKYGKRNTTIDRIDVNGNYCKKNCRWATQKQQQNNKRNNTFLTYDGKTMTLAEWGRYRGITNNQIQYRIRAKKSIEKILGY